jgi:serine/threonine protein kinase
MAGNDRTQSEWTPVAIKVLDKAAMTPDDMRVFKSEIHVLEKVNAVNPPFCLKMKEWFELEPSFVIIMEHMAGGELLRWGFGLRA